MTARPTANGLICEIMSGLYVTAVCLFVLAALVAYGAGGLTCRLAGGLALTAAAFFYSVL